MKAFAIPPSAAPPKNPPKAPETLLTPQSSELIHPTNPSYIAFIAAPTITRGKATAPNIDNPVPNIAVAPANAPAGSNIFAIPAKLPKSIPSSS